MSKLYITDLEGKSIEVTDLEDAKTQCETFVGFSKKNDGFNLDYWQHMLDRLNELEEPEPEAEVVTEINGIQLSAAVIECRKKFGEHKGKGFIKNDRTSPLFPAHSCARSENRIRQIENLEVGESTNNSASTKITRVY